MTAPADDSVRQMMETPRRQAALVDRLLEWEVDGHGPNVSGELA
jgi:hypothetical protein